MDPILTRIQIRISRLRHLRDIEGWPEPTSVEDLRNDPRVQLRNRLDGEPENLELAAALILLVAQDQERAGDAVSF